MLFGPLTGSLLSFAAATLASSLSFLIARWLGRDLLQRYVGHTTVFQAIERGIARSGCDFLILTRPGAALSLQYSELRLRPDGDPLLALYPDLGRDHPAGSGHLFGDGQRTGPRGVTLAFALKLSLAGGLLFAPVQIGKRFARARRVAACSEEVRHDPT